MDSLPIGDYALPSDCRLALVLRALVAELFY
jgi:hypothetical protein